MQLTPEHEALRDTLNRFIDKEVNPHVDQWARDEIFPAPNSLS
jgi:citronellyl-CoA dehydrogenase